MQPLQQGLQLEADRGFTNLQGRRDTFADFLRHQLEQVPLPLEPREQEQLQALRAGYGRYDQLGLGQRQRLVRQSREWLLALRRRARPPAPVNPPRLKLVDAPAAPSSRAAQTLELSTPLGDVKGIGPRTAARLAQLGLLVVRDLLHHYPRDYLDYANLKRIQALEPGETATIVATVRRSHGFVSPRNPNLGILKLQLQDPTGRLRVSWFFAGRRFASPGWLAAQQRQFPAGATLAVSGLVKQTPYGPAFQDPLMEVLEHAHAPVQSRAIGRLLPVYGLTEGLSADRIRQTVDAILPVLQAQDEPLPLALRQQQGLIERHLALLQIHQPQDQAQLQAARSRLVFDEFLLLQLGLAQRRHQLRQHQAPVLEPSSGGALVEQFLQLLPFALTGAQQRVLQQIRSDLARAEPMARLLQGDVGSGKTVVALAALLAAIGAGCQGALMAPTEVLAQQHFHKVADWLSQLHVSTALLTGSTPARRRRQILEDLVNGQLQLLVGTHALLEDPVAFARLGLVVVDEQHRFGVNQRNRLLAKGLQPHLLTMTATPIPRTLALSLHGDLDVSQIDELPPGRQPIATRVLRGSERDQAYDLIRSEVAKGQRAYVVLPLVEESEKLDLRSAVEVHRHLSEDVFADLAVGLLHGRLSSEAKQQAIAAFAAGETQVLVSTTVVEVGVDVPAATVMVIEHAERFGLAQLHQLRGRVGRGADQSHCLLLNDSNNPLARQRLDLLARSCDGFEIAEMDLRLRGPGQVLGTRQSGLPDLALASLSSDGAVLEQARTVAQAISASDPELRQHPQLAALLREQRQRLAATAAQLN
ncbi:MAG: ATP-dependent DNA helicase RecG [Cyanobacteria bacterium K_DeepCast_35m_m2_023]|nr:ATP-dependent DNA helicase RecG [Cyanobacteria bacterium K_DeepCast_35m_m2_023]